LLVSFPPVNNMLKSLRSSIRVSPDFNLARHSSPSFGSHRNRSCCSARSEVDAKRRHCAREGSCLSYRVTFAFTAPLGLVNPMTRDCDRLLGPCYKTGRRRRRPTRDRNAARVSKDTRYTRPLNYPSPAKPDSGSSQLPRQSQTSSHSTVHQQGYVA